MKNILNKIEFHYTYLFVSLSFILTGSFLNLIIFTSLILFHELGHFIMIKKYNLEFIKLIIYPYGGYIKYNSFLNLEIKKELIIASSGILFQIVFFFLIYLLYQNNLIREYTYHLFKNYHYNILLFNLLPIYPLDGSKVLTCLLNKKISYRLTNKLVIIISFITIIITSYYYLNNYTYLLVLFILIKNIIEYYQNINYLYYRFLLERYIYQIDFKRIKIINNKNNMFKDYKHIIKEKNKYLTEKSFLNKIFDNNDKI